MITNKVAFVMKHAVSEKIRLLISEVYLLSSAMKSRNSFTLNKIPSIID